MAASAVAVYECVYEWVNVTIQCKPICHLSFTILLILCLAVYCWFFSDYEISVTGVNACTSLQLIKSLSVMFILLPQSDSNSPTVYIFSTFKSTKYNLICLYPTEDYFINQNMSGHKKNQVLCIQHNF